MHPDNQSKLQVSLDIAYTVLSIGAVLFTTYMIGEQFGLWRKVKAEYVARYADRLKQLRDEATARRIVSEALDE